MKTFVIALLTLAFSSPLYAVRMSAHFCQPYQNGGLPVVDSYYQNQGSVLAAKDVSFTCPVFWAAAVPAALQARVFYATQGVGAIGAIRCRLWKISASNQTVVGTEVSGHPNQASGFLDVYNSVPQADTIGANVECWLKPGAKILGYHTD